MNRRRTVALGSAVTALALALAAATSAHAATPRPAAAAIDPGQVRINQLQVIGTHNSYHVEATPAEEAIRGAFDASGEQALEYGEPALATQLGPQHVRQLELDVWADPKGGKYANPLLRAVTLGGPTDPVMKQPGTKVFHIQEIDYHSNCLTFVRCLTGIKAWSDAHAGHVPVTVLVEFKDERLVDTGLPAVPTDPLPWTAARMDTVDSDIRSVFPAPDLITPDDVRAGAATLESAVLTTGWPTLAASRGKVMFLMDNPGTYRDSYLAGHPSLAGRVLFTNSTPGQPDAAFVEENDPTGANQARIESEVRSGYFVRTRADVDTVQARSGDTSMREAALASGAQWVSTDYPVKADSARFGTGYAVQLPNGDVARCAPVQPTDVTVPCDPGTVIPTP